MDLTNVGNYSLINQNILKPVFSMPMLHELHFYQIFSQKKKLL